MLCVVAACSQLSLGEPSPGGSTQGSESVNPTVAISVAEALEMEPGQEVTVCGYYVGFVSSNTMSHAIFSESHEAPNTNLLLCDELHMGDENLCIPVELPAGSAVRKELNTFDNPELHNQRLLIRGRLETYFRVNGIKKPKAWRLLSPDEEPPTRPDEKDDPTPDSTPDPGKDNKTYPQIIEIGTIERAR